MKPLLIALLAICLYSCSSQKKVLNSWIGNNKFTLISSWGYPTRIQEVDDGEILVYTSQRGAMLTTGQHVGAYDHKMFFVDKMGTIYNWLTQTNYIPPQQLNVNMYVRHQ